MSLVDGIDELRHAISKPKDALFGQLTDLIVALNDASTPSSINKRTTLQYKLVKKNKRRRCRLNVCSPGDLAGDSGCSVPDKKRDKPVESLSNEGFFGAPDVTDSEKELSNHNTSSATLVNKASPVAKPQTAVYSGATTTNNNNSNGFVGSVSASEKPTWHVTMISRQHDNHVDETTTKWKFFRQQRANSGGVAATGHPPVESDSFPETWTPARRNRRKRLIKKMAVDVATTNAFAESSDIYHYEGMDVENTSKTNTFHQNFSRIRRSPSRFSAKHLFLSSKRPMIKYSGRNSESSMEYDYDINFCGTSESEVSLTSDEEGHQGDDEQSDWYFEIPNCPKSKCGKYDPATTTTNRLEDRWSNSDDPSPKNPDDYVMGIPDIRKMMMQKLSKEQAMDLNSYIQTIESSDTDISQSSINLRCSTKIFGKRLLTKNIPAMTSALNKRIITFLQYPLDSDLPLGHLKKRERKEALRLASFYNLDVCCQASGYTHMYTLTKTKYTLKP